MADADVTITAGSGTKIDTRTVGAGTDEHRQVVVIGDPTTASDVAGVDGTGNLQVAIGGFNLALGLPVNLRDDGGDYIATLPVSGPLTDTQLRATAVPVSGTITANAGTGTLAVSAASLPLPSGASTAAKQPALGTAGTSSADVLTVQGRASMTPLLVDGSATTQPISGTVTANVGTGTQAVSGTVAVTGVATETTLAAASAKLPAALAAGGGLKVEGVAGGVAQPISGTVTANAGTNLNTSNLALEVGGNLAGVLAATTIIADPVATLGTTTYTEATTKGQIVGAVRRDADTTLVNTTNEIGPLQMDANGRLKVEAFSGETLPVSLASTTVTGTVAVTQSGTWDEVGINDSGNSITVDGTVTANIGTGTLAAVTAITNVVHVDDNSGSLTVDGGVAVNASAANGCDMFLSIDLDESEEDVKTSAGTLYGWYIINRATTPRYVKLYNATAANVTVGTTTPVLVLPIPGSTSNYVGANMAFAPGIKFATAICAAATTGIAHNDTGAPAANDVVVNFFYL